MVDSQCGSLRGPKIPEMMITGKYVSIIVGAAASTVGIAAVSAVAVAAQAKAPMVKATSAASPPLTVRCIPYRSTPTATVAAPASTDTTTGERMLLRK